METKKTWENAPPVLIPRYQALALPLNEDKQRKACPRRVIYINPLRPDNPKRIYTKTHSTRGELHLIYIYKGNRTWENIKIHPRRRFCCITAAYRFKFAKFEVTDSNVSKTSFRDWPYNWPEVSSNMLNLTTHPHSGRLFGANLHIFF